MKLSAKGAAFIQSFESCRLVAYQDTHVPPIWTIGDGHTGPEVHAGLVWTQEQADTTFINHDVAYAEHAVETLVTVPLTQNQYDALVSLVFNIGATAFKNSTLLRELNLGHYAVASSQFLVWDHSDGVVSAGLMRRRKAEQQIFDTSILKAVIDPPVSPVAPAPPIALPAGLFTTICNALLSIFNRTPK